MTNLKPVILIADDNEDDCELVERVLPNGDFQVRRATSYQQALSILHGENIYMAFVDLFLDVNDRMAYGIAIYERFNPILPIILMSGHDASRTDDALRQLKEERLALMSKRLDFNDRSTVSARMTRHAGKIYNRDIAIDFDGKNTSWMALAGKLRNEAIQTVDETQLAHELESLVRKLFCDWDQSTSPNVRAARLDLDLIPHSGSRTAVLRVRPSAELGDAQADVILKIKQSNLEQTDSRAAENSQDEHPQFERYKNLVGGYGLRERRFARTCHFVGQVYSVPYFQYEQTMTFGDFFRAERGDDAGCERIESMTRYLYERCMAHFDQRIVSGNELLLSEYCATRIRAGHRLRAIQRDLTSTTRPSAIKQDDDGSWVMPMNGSQIRLVDPVPSVLGRRAYRAVGERVTTRLRHGDLHANNVLVDVERRCCWFIDYENFDLHHFNLIDHVEFEASVLFSLTKTEGNLQPWVSLIDAVSQPELGQIADVDLSRATTTEKSEFRKALAALRAVRDAAQKVNGVHSPTAYYHALMYEALRVAGKADAERVRRWNALIAAAILFSKIEA